MSSLTNTVRRVPEPPRYPSENKEQHRVSSNIKESYGDLVATMKDLGAALIPATAVQYEAPPNGAARTLSVGGVRNPTLDIVSDPRRSALSDEVAATDTALRLARAILGPHIDALRQATARWEGQEGTPA